MQSCVDVNYGRWGIFGERGNRKCGEWQRRFWLKAMFTPPMLSATILYRRLQQNLPFSLPRLLNWNLFHQKVARQLRLQARQPRNRGSIPGRTRDFFFSPKRTDRLWGPPSLVINGIQRFFPLGQSYRAVKLTTHLHPQPRLRTVEVITVRSAQPVNMLLVSGNFSGSSRKQEHLYNDSWRIKDHLDVTCYFISLLMCSTCFGH